MILSKKALETKPSVTLEITAECKRLKNEGKNIIGFTAGEPDMNTPTFIIEAAKEAFLKGYTKYTPVAGLPELRKTVAEKFNRVNGIFCDENNIVVSSGAKSSLYHAFLAIIDDGDEVIVPSPYWITYIEQIRLCGGVAVTVKTKKENSFKITAEELENAITEKTKVFLINSPCNPTGAVYSESELQLLAAVCEKHGIIIVSDEIYERLIFGETKHVSFATVSKYASTHTITIDGVSKAYAMTGWRIGYACAPVEIARAMAALQGHTTSNACSFAQYATITAIKSGEEEIEKMRMTFEKRRKLLLDGLSKIDGLSFTYPDGAFYVFVDISLLLGDDIADANAFAKKLLDYGVACVPGTAFGDDKKIRLSYALSEENIIEGVNRLAKFVKSMHR